MPFIRTGNSHVKYTHSNVQLENTPARAMIFMPSSRDSDRPDSHRLKLLRKLSHGIERLHEMAKRQLLPSSDGERMRCADRVLDLPAVDAAPGEVADLGAGDVRVDLADERGPDLLLGLLRELVKVQRDVDPREEGLVERFDPVRGEEHDPAVVLQVAKAARGVSGGYVVQSWEVTYNTATMALRSRSW